MSEINWTPLRSFDDFAGRSARFQLPDLTDNERWSRRVVFNLMFYQSNYFVTYLAIFLLISVMFPLDVIVGLVGSLVGVVVVSLACNAQSDVERFRRAHPIVTWLILGGCAIFVMKIFVGLTMFIFAIALPLLLILLHASCRMRNLSNKLNIWRNLSEDWGIKHNTPMGFLLQALGIELA